MRRYTKSDLEILSLNGLAAELPAPRKRQNLEWQLQYQTFQWWRGADFGVPRHLFFHVPNGSVLGGTVAERGLKGRMLKLTGMENGVADCFLSVPRGGYHGLYIEFKSPTGMLSPEQKTFLGDVEAQGYFTAVVRTFEDAQIVITEYLTQCRLS